MPQNIYDNDAFFAGYATLRRSREGLNGAPEWPALRAMLPDVKGKRVLDLGCGYGWFCRFAQEQGAAEVMGVDVSEKMLARAREAAQHEGLGNVTFEEGDAQVHALAQAHSTSRSAASG